MLLVKRFSEIIFVDQNFPLMSPIEGVHVQEYSSGKGGLDKAV